MATTQFLNVEARIWAACKNSLVVRDAQTRKLLTQVAKKMQELCPNESLELLTPREFGPLARKALGRIWRGER